MPSLSIATRDRIAVSSALAAVTILSWVYLVDMAGDMTSMPMDPTAMTIRPWTAGYFAMMFLMSFGPILNQISIVILGAMDGNTAAGQYGAAVRISYIIQPFIVAQNVAIQPMIADLWRVAIATSFGASPKSPRVWSSWRRRRRRRS